MLSGPDLGGGFLHQLTFEAAEETSSFTFHAQDGGSDAGGPPLGPLDGFGFVHPPAACMFGGPRCWHRRFRLGLGEAGRVRMAYNRGRFVLETMIGQAYRDAPVAVEAGLKEVIDRVADPFEREGVDWYVGGSGAAWLLGARVLPHDLDLGTTRAGVDRFAALLPEYLIEPLAPTDWPGRGIVHGARAFVGTFREGIRVEWATDLDRASPRPDDEWSGRLDDLRTETLTFHGHRVRVTRPEYALARAVERHRPSVIAPLVAWLREHGSDRPLLHRLLERPGISASDRDRVLAELV